MSIKIRSKKQKRVTLVRLLIKYISIALIASLLFAAIYKRYIENYAAEKAIESVDKNSVDAVREINHLQDSTNIINDIDSYLSMYSLFYVELEDIFEYKFIDYTMQGCGAVSALIDENNNIVASNRLDLCMLLKLPDDESARYQCRNTPDSIPEVKQLYKDYLELRNMADKTDEVKIELDSIYVNRNDRTFIPGKGSLKIYKDRFSKNGDVLFRYDYETAKEIGINIQIDDDNYELVDLSDDGLNNVGCLFYGTPDEKFEEMLSAPFYVERPRSNYSRSAGGIFYGPKPTAYRTTPLYINGKEYTLAVKFTVNTEAPEALAFYLKRVLGFTAVMLTAAVLFCIVKNFRNKVQYEFEDHQKALTNNLAHDIKTPLTAISGYAENLQKAIESQDTEKASGYISAILENVDYTDSIVNRTLELNQLSDIKKINKTDINMRELAEKLINKYKLMAEEKNITVNISGEMSLQADETSICSAVENLLTNALKYTIPSGGIDIILDKKSFTVTNDIFQKVDTKNLTMPFVKGDTARSKKLGSGLGLSIVKSSAELNGLRLSISSTDNKFTAVLSK